MKLLAIDDDPQTLALIRAALKQRTDAEIITVADPLDGLAVIKREHPQVVLLDLMLPNLRGMDVLERIIAIDPDIAVIMMTAHYSTESAVEAIQKGASDYFDKPLDLDRLRNRIDELFHETNQRIQTCRLDSELLESYSFHGIISRSPLMLEALARVRRVASHYRTLLVTGATGTGKELVARALHHLSPVANQAFVVCNCAALPRELIESELFGHVKGAFTGAFTDKLGIFEAANGGTLFLDELGELPLASQSKLLRAVQHQQIQPLGTTLPRQVNLRIVCATNRNLRALVEANEFREDLFFRLSMVEIQLPGLSERKEDLPLLIRHFIKHFALSYGKRIDTITHRAEAVLGHYSWPGNIRELENAIGYACMMTDSHVIDINDLPAIMRTASFPSVSSPDILSLDAMQRSHARQVLAHFGGDKVRTAKILGVSRSTLYRLLSAGAASAASS